MSFHPTEACRQEDAETRIRVDLGQTITRAFDGRRNLVQQRLKTTLVAKTFEARNSSPPVAIRIFTT